MEVIQLELKYFNLCFRKRYNIDPGIYSNIILLELKKDFVSSRKSSSPRIKQTFFRNLLHSENDIPAMVVENVSSTWYKYGLIHRENDKPAHINICGGVSRYWYKNGKLHRGNGRPAILRKGGSKWSKMWFEEGINIEK